MTAPAAPVPLADHHVLAGFDCGEPALNDWLINRARKSEGRFARTYVACADDRVAAYFCVAAGSVERAAAPGKLRRNAPNAIPMAIIGRLAVDKSHAGRGLGADLLQDAFRRILAAHEHVGFGAVLVHAKDDRARAFYLKYAEFIEYPADSKSLYLPMDTILSSIR